MYKIEDVHAVVGFWDMIDEGVLQIRSHSKVSCLTWLLTLQSSAGSVARLKKIRARLLLTDNYKPLYFAFSPTLIDSLWI